jgi:hypothetical protein
MDSNFCRTSWYNRNRETDRFLNEMPITLASTVLGNSQLRLGGAADVQIPKRHHMQMMYFDLGSNHFYA